MAVLPAEGNEVEASVTSWQGRSLDVSLVIDPQGQNKKTRVLSASVTTCDDVQFFFSFYLLFTTCTLQSVT